MFVNDHLNLLIKREDDPFYIDHLGYIKYTINTRDPLEHTQECIS